MSIDIHNRKHILSRKSEKDDKSKQQWTNYYWNTQKISVI